MAPKPKTSAAIPIVIILIVVFIGGIAVLGIVAAIAIPAFLRARMAGNEAVAIGALQSMAGAQATWAATHGGKFDEPKCLGAPAVCGDAAGASLVTPDIASLEPRSGYYFEFLLRPGVDQLRTAGDEEGAVATAEESPGVSAPGAPTDAEVRAQLEQFSTPETGASSVRPPAPPAAERPLDLGGYAYWAMPTSPGISGNRRFCVDETGVVLAYAVDAPFSAPTYAQPGCPDTGSPVR
jgi:hypothetical protein